MLEIVSFAVALYLFGGLLVAIPFVLRGVNRVDPAAAGASLGFRLLIVPGTIALWPIMLGKWRAACVNIPNPTGSHNP